MFLTLVALSPIAEAGVTQVLQTSGPYQTSIDGAGSSLTDVMSLQITRPTPGATVARAFAAVTGVHSQGDPGPASLSVAGIPLSLDQVQFDGSGLVYTRFDDVTAELSAYLERLPVGTTAVTTIEGGAPGKNDGHMLYVLWEDPTLPVATAALSFGSELTGLNPSLGIDTESTRPAWPRSTGAPLRPGGSTARSSRRSPLRTTPAWSMSRCPARTGRRSWSAATPTSTRPSSRIGSPTSSGSCRTGST